MTERLYSTDAYAREVSARVVDVDRVERRVLLDRTVFYPGGGGQPPDTGELVIGDDRLRVVRVTADHAGVWHWLEELPPPRGTELVAAIDWGRRYRLMRTHTAMHALCGVIWARFGAPVTGGNMEPGQGRLDFELPEWDTERDLGAVEEELNRQLQRALLVRISFLPREEADRDPSLIRTKVDLLPRDLTVVRVVDIVGLDRQADGGTHVASTAEVGQVRIVKAESKGRGFRRLRLTLDDNDPSRG